MVDYDEVGILLGKLILEFMARSDLSFYVEQSTRKYKWESYEGRDEYCDTIKAKQVMGRKQGVDLSSSTSSLSNTYA